MTDRKHVDWIDLAKGIGIILVVFGHVSDGAFRAGIAFSPEVFHQLYSTIYSFHMPLFFFLAGLFFPSSWNRRGTAGLIRSKVDTIVYPYLLWSLIQGVIEVCLSRYTNQHTPASAIFTLLWHPRQQFWYLYALFFIFVLACLLYAVIPQRWRSVVFLGSIACYVFKNDLPHIVPINYLAANSVYFFAGAVLEHLAKSSFHPRSKALLLSIAVFAMVQVGYAYVDPLYSQPLYAAICLVVAFASIGSVIIVSQWYSARGAAWLSLIGTQSLAIYLMHTIFASGTRIALHKLLGVDNLAIHLIVPTVAGVLLPVAIATFVERRNIQGVFSMPDRWRLARQRQ